MTIESQTPVRYEVPKLDSQAGDYRQTIFGEGLRSSFAMPNPFVLTNKICLIFLLWFL